MFCPKCGSILVPKKDDSKTSVCTPCGYKSSDNEKIVIKENVINDDKEIEVVEKGEIQTLPKTKADCPKCTNNEAYFWLVQTRAADEPETKFLKCVKCNHTWRDYN